MHKTSLNHAQFTPAIKSGKIQTILASIIGSNKVPPYHREHVKLPDGDRLLIDISQPKDWQLGDPTVVLMHGLCGCSRSDYILRMADLFLKENLRVVRVNLRGQGDEHRIYAKKIYHAGCSDDLKQVLTYLSAQAPDSKNIVIGFSISGNILLKLLGEMKDEAKTLVDYAIAICPPMDLAKCAEVINEPRNHAFQRYFLKLLIEMVEKRHKMYPELGPVPMLNKHIPLYVFDDQYTSIQAEFDSADEYYEQCSSIKVIDQITVKTDILLSLDDPFVDNTKIMALNLPENVAVHATEHGGHMGYLEKPKGFKLISRWMDKRLLHWVQGHL